MLTQGFSPTLTAQTASRGWCAKIPLLSFLTPAAFLIVVVSARAQSVTPVTPPEPLKVFLDCTAKCDEDFLRTEIRVISYVRDRQDADVHVLVTTQATGSGGIEYTVQFIGLGRFSKIEHTLKFASAQNATDDERRRSLAEVLKRGLVRYVWDTPLAQRMKITFLPDSLEGAGHSTGAKDRWNLWVFRTTFLGTFNGESSNSGRSIRLDSAASRTSEQWKVSFSAAANYRSDRFVLSPEDTFRSISRGFGFDGLVVKSVTEHWSLGAIANASSSTFLNYDLSTRVAAGPEYNLFPYSASTEKLLTIQYTLGLSSFDYREVTVFGVTSERLPDHRLGVLFAMLQPWGTAGAEVGFSQFLTKPDKYNLNVTGQANIRVTKGFALNAFVTVSRPRDQLYLPAAGATPEEILVREQQLATTYRYSMVFGFTYTFGSIFNNVVNPRFGRAGEDAPIF
jgi:hypothetical protein